MTTRLRPFFSYYGSKWRLSSRYARPVYGKVIEPFAGSACYSLLYPEKEIELVDVSEAVCLVWQYLIGVTESEIRSLPLLEDKEKIPTSLPIEAQYLIGFWVSKGCSYPRKSMSGRPGCGYWGDMIRSRIARQLKHIRHWSIRRSSYSDIENTKATWFVDPPYQVGGKHYPHHEIDYTDLATWCKTRNGQVIVCENDKASWLPFDLLHHTKGIRKNSVEVVWGNNALD